MATAYDYAAYDYAGMNQSAALNTATSGQCAQGVAQSAAKSSSIRERLQGANKRAESVLAELRSLSDQVAPNNYNALSGIGQSNDLRADKPVSTLSTDVSQLLDTVGRIETQLQSLVRAITGS